MEKEPSTYAHSITHEFLKSALADGAQNIQHSWNSRWAIHYLNPTLWAKRLNITGIYFGTSLTLDEIGQRYGDISSEAIRQIIEKSIHDLHRNSSPETQTKFPLTSIPLAKPLSVTNNIENKAITNASNLEAISKQLKNSIADLDQITTNTNLTKKEVRLALKIIKSQSAKAKKAEWHQIDDLKKNTWQAICNIIEHSDDKVQTQAAIDILDQYHATKLLRKKDPSLLTFTDILGKKPEGFTKNIYIVLRSANIPVIRLMNQTPVQKKYEGVSYHVPIRFVEEAKEVLKNSPLKNDIKNHVQQIAGPQTLTLPSTTEFSRPKKFKKVGSLIPSVRKANLKNISFYQLYNECPVPVYMYKTAKKSGYLYQAAREQEVKEYLDQKLQELGIKPHSRR